jgi:ribonuclease G
MRTELFVSRVGEQTWSALREGGSAVEFRVEERGDSPRLGRIIKARVTRILPAIQAAFVNVGLERDAFLHASDLLLPGDPPPAVEQGAAGEPQERRSKTERVPIQRRLEPGSELVVQISRESRATKGDRATCFLGIPGRLLVLLPLVPQVGVSRRIFDQDERERLAAVLRDLDCGSRGFIARTAARGVDAGALRAEAARLLETWKAIRTRAETVQPPAVLHDEPPLAIRLLRDAPAEGFGRIVLDDPDEHDRVQKFLHQVDSALASRIELYDGERPLFATHGLDDEIWRALRPRVWLRSGGYLIIEQTEAMVSIDVNTGKSVQGDSQADTSFETNLEAAEEIARQLRLRDMGGIVVVDFVDMDSIEHRRRLVEVMTAALRDDPARSKIVSLSDIGLMQLTRKRARSGLHVALMQPCPSCSGQGRVIRSDVVAALAKTRNAGSGEPT